LNTARKGSAFENEVRQIFEAAGFAVIRGAGSKGFFDSPDGLIKPDLIASKAGTKNRYEIQIICAQCKVRKIK
jgi:Holliday junction resolvase|tara:strand:- start:24 stop:242 length:219 start_codon:yes stop_codon:yes gene_type:complete